MFQAIHLTSHFCLAERGVDLLSDFPCYYPSNKPCNDEGGGITENSSLRGKQGCVPADRRSPTEISRCSKIANSCGHPGKSAKRRIQAERGKDDKHKKSQTRGVCQGSVNWIEGVTR